MELWAAFLLGVSSAPHCMAMCGGIASALMVGSQASGGATIASDRVGHSALQSALLFGTGKMLAYMGLGLLAGLGGFLLINTQQQALAGLRFFAGLLMILLGLYTAGWWNGLRHVEQSVYRFWQPLLSQARHVSLQSWHGKLLAGAAWGLLPCGIVYTMLATALASGNIMQGMLIMMSFGLGTMPFVLSAGGLARLSSRWMGSRWFRSLLGLILIGFGIGSLMMAMR
jgi:uncharacterized protein